MNKVIDITGKQYSPRPEIEAEARAWIVTLDGDPARDELEAFKLWLNRSPLHREVFQQTAMTWQLMDRFAELYYRGQELHTTIESPGRPEKTFRKFVFGAALAGLFLCAIVLGIQFQQPADNEVAQTSETSTEYATAIGEIRTMNLPDGSVLQLNSNTRITVAYSDAARRIHLHGGEAYFEVRHAADRPFLVYTEKYVIAATGTAFSVTNRDDELGVLVTEGRVEVSALKPPLSGAGSQDPHGTAAPLVPLAEGQRIILDERQDLLESVQRVAPDVIEKHLAWRDGMLMFDNDPLGSVIAEINRYTTVRIQITDSSIRDLRFGGYFRIGDVPLILATMEENYGLKVDRITDNLVYLSRKPAHD